MEVDLDKAMSGSIAKVGGKSGDTTTPDLYLGSHGHEDPNN